MEAGEIPFHSMDLPSALGDACRSAPSMLGDQTTASGELYDMKVS